MKKRLLLVFGGRSGEHEVSLRSAKNIYSAIDRRLFDVFLVGIDREGNFRYIGKNIDRRRDFSNIIEEGRPCTITLEHNSTRLIAIENGKMRFVTQIDVAFPVLHGTFGEDGTIQGLFEMAGLPYVGAGVLGSSVCMDKEICKRILRDNGLKITPFEILKMAMTEVEKGEIISKAIERFGFPIFIKPANLGSSVGISKALNYKKLKSGIEDAFMFDSKVILEKCISGREIECAVMGNEVPEAAVPGEVVPVNEFYDYEAKYLKEGSRTIVPADLSREVVDLIRDLAIRAYKSCELEGMARVDFFLTAENEVYINEINTIPGFTEISMFPMMWMAEGMNYGQIIKRLISLAFDRQRIMSRLRRSYR